MSYQAIPSAKGEIKSILVMYNGLPESLDFVTEVVESFAPRRVLIWAYKKKDHAQLQSLQSNHRNCRILPQASDIHQDLELDIWCRDHIYQGKNATRESVFYQGKPLIPNFLAGSNLVQEIHLLEHFFPFGNILIDPPYVFANSTAVDALQLPGLAQGVSKEAFILQELFSDRSAEWKLVPVGLSWANESFEVLSEYDLPAYMKHLDLMLTVSGTSHAGAPILLLARLESPDFSLMRTIAMANSILDEVASNLEERGMLVLRNPVPVLKNADETLWLGYYNNLVVEAPPPPLKKTVWLPNFKQTTLFGNYLESIACQNAGIWKSLGFEVKFISKGISKLYKGGDRGGGLRCLTVDFR